MLTLNRCLSLIYISLQTTITHIIRSIWLYIGVYHESRVSESKTSATEYWLLLGLHETSLFYTDRLDTILCRFAYRMFLVIKEEKKTKTVEIKSGYINHNVRFLLCAKCYFKYMSLIQIYNGCV